VDARFTGKVTTCLGNPERGLQYLQEAAQARKLVSGDDDYWYAVDLFSIGFALRDIGRPGHPDRVAEYRKALASVYALPIDTSSN
jgi:hypothetical protein